MTQGIVNVSRALLALLLLDLSPQLASAQSNPAFARAVADPQEQKMVIDAAKRSNTVLENPCGDGHYGIANQFVIYKPLVFDGAGALSSGSWKQVVSYSGCGATLVLNVLVSVDGSRASAYPLMPGTTHADPLLQLDVFKSPGMQSAIQRWRDPNCTKVYVADTAFVDKDPSAAARPGAKGPPWREIWILAACGRRERIPILFTPDSTGTSFTLFARAPGSPSEMR